MTWWGLHKYKRLLTLVFSSLFYFVSLGGTTFAQVIDTEDFGSGPYPGAALPAGQTTYIYNAPSQPANFPNILEDGEYVIATDTQQGFSNWLSVGDHTTGSGYMMLVNADDDQVGEFYRRSVNLTANTTYDFLTYLVNVNSQLDYDYCTNNEGGLVLPNVTLQVEAANGTVLASLDTGDIPFDVAAPWEEYKLVFTTSASTSTVNVVLINNSLGGCGNDLAIDDITFRVAVTMVAANDSATVTDTSTAQTAVLTLGANDTLSGSALPGTELYYVATGSSLPAGLSLNGSTGTVDVAAGTAEGTYSFEYQVCETNNQFNCDTATATVIVDFPPLPITAVNDNGTVLDSSAGFTNVLSVLVNDTIDGVTDPDDFELSVSSGSSVPAGLTFNVNTGGVGVAPGTPSGIYSFDYDICEDGNTSNCETATVTIDVTNPGGGSFCPAGTSAVAGTFHVVSATAAPNQTQYPERTVGTPLAEGTVETGSNSGITYYGAITMDLTADASSLVPEGEVIEIVLSSAWGTQARAEILMSADGVTYTSLGTTGFQGSVYGAYASNVLRYDEFIVPAGGAKFVQVLQENQGVRVDGVVYNNQCQPGAPTIAAEDDEETIAQSATAQTDILNVVDNDTFDGLTPSSFDLAISASSSLPAELTFDTATGAVGAVAGAPAGVYSFEYDLCEPGTTNCDTALVTITIDAPTAAPDLSVSKSVATYDPLGLGLYDIPGNDIVYTISVVNSGAGPTDADTLFLVDVMPSEIYFYNADIDGDGPETNPVSFSGVSSGLQFTYSTDVGYSNDSVKPTEFSECDYAPTLVGYLDDVTFICFNPKGAMAPGSDWSVSFRTQIR